MNIKIKLVTVLFLLLLTTNVVALEKVGTTSFQYLKVLADARSTAMGEAYSAVARNSDALFWNPARITYIEGYDFTASYMDYFLDVPANIIELEEARVIFDDLKINEVSAMMYDMEHPYVIYKNWTVTPWDICNALLEEGITDYHA